MIYNVHYTIPITFPFDVKFVLYSIVELPMVRTIYSMPYHIFNKFRLCMCESYVLKLENNIQKEKPDLDQFIFWKNYFTIMDG